MNTHGPKNRYALTALLTLAVLGGFSACSGDPMAPEITPSFAAVASPTAQDCTKVDGVWVCTEATTTGGGDEEGDGPTCILINGIWVCENVD